jgi:dGTPase
VWGADVVLAPLNLCAETLDGIRNHSWSRPAPSTPEGEVVAWADRIAYVGHDFEDAVDAGIVTPAMLPDAVRAIVGADRRSRQLHVLISGVVESSLAASAVGLRSDLADVLAEFRAFNYEHIYMRPASTAQGDAVIRVLRALVEFYADRPNTLPGLEPEGGVGAPAGSDAALRDAVTYVAGMTDRFAFAQARAHLGWDPAGLPAGLDTGR